MNNCRPTGLSRIKKIRKKPPEPNYLLTTDYPHMMR